MVASTTVGGDRFSITKKSEEREVANGEANIADYHRIQQETGPREHAVSSRRCLQLQYTASSDTCVDLQAN